MNKLLALSVATLVLSTQIQAQEKPKDDYKWIAGFGEFYSAEKIAKDGPEFLKNGLGGGVEYGFQFLPEWAARLEASYMEIDVENAFLDESGSRVGADLLYMVSDDMTYVFGGLKLTKIHNDDVMANIGIGKHWGLSNNFKVITEMAAYKSIGSPESVLHMGFKMGLAYAFGGSTAPSTKDGDNDGVVDSKDQCLDTPAGTQVDAVGCTLDLDGDGVINRLDNCPDTPMGTAVDSYGCNNDLDGDSIVNSMDKCLNTPAGTAVGAKGCSLVLDTDQDGVLDDKDDCANTPMTDKVDERGCSVFTQQEASINIKVMFDKNSSVIVNPNDPQFADFAKFMKRFPNTNTVIEGHASAPGRADYNLMLSQKRANAVRTLLIEQHGIKNDRLTAVGFGETQLLDTANTAKANKANRRITAKVSVSNKVNVKR